MARKKKITNQQTLNMSAAMYIIGLSLMIVQVIVMVGMS